MSNEAAAEIDLALPWNSNHMHVKDNRGRIVASVLSSLGVFTNAELDARERAIVTAVNERDALLAEVGRLREALTGGVRIIATERARHFAVEGWTTEHDDHHTDQSLAQAAACYAWPPMRPLSVKKAWPWQMWEWKPELFGADADDAEKAEARIRVLAKAGALIAAEIDRLERARAARSGKVGEGNG